jgi:hypothetical protein
MLVIVDESNDRNLIFKTRDEYYDSGSVIDWTNKLDLSKERSIVFLSELSPKRLVLTYKQDKDPYNEEYLNETKEIYGQVEYTFESDYLKGVETKELIFSPTPLLQTTFGAIVPSIAGASPKNNIRVLYDGGELNCNSYNINDYIDDETSGEVGLTTYPSLTHFDNPTSPTLDINFSTCDYYFYQLNSITGNNLFNTYYRRTLGQIDSGRMLTAYFYLNEKDIYDLKLNHKIKIQNSFWNINKIYDYDANINSTTKVELISIEDAVSTAKRSIKKLTPDDAPVQGGTSGAKNLLIKQSDTSLNIVDGDNVDVTGVGNIVSGNNVLIRGNNNIVWGNNSFILGNKNIVNGQNTFVLGNETTNSGGSFSTSGYSNNNINDELGFLLTDEDGNNLTT